MMDCTYELGLGTLDTRQETTYTQEVVDTALAGTAALIDLMHAETATAVLLYEQMRAVRAKKTATAIGPAR